MKKVIFLYTLIFLIHGCAPINSGPLVTDHEAFEEARFQQSLIVEDHKKQLDQLMPAMFQIYKANADLCEQVSPESITPTLGFYTDVSQFIAQKYKPLAPLNASSSLKAPIKVIYIIKGSPASKGLKIGDEIISINDVPLEDTLKKNTQLLYDTLQENGLTSVNFKILRENKEKIISLNPVYICNYGTYINTGSGGSNAAQEDNNALADGQNIFVGTGIINLAKTDQKVALIVGHELAHNTMAHIDKKMSNALLGTILGATVAVFTGVDMTRNFTALGAGAYSQGFEAEADYLGTYYVARAGYDINNIYEFWRTMATKNPSSIHLEGTTHPSTAKRFLAIKKTVEEINEKKRSGQPLNPDIGELSITETK